MKYTYASALSTGLTLFFVAFGNAQVVLAQQPTIVGVTGSMTQGSVVTINGSNLQAETMQGWDGFFANHPTAWSFEGPSPQSDGFSLIGPAGTTYDTSVKLLGNQSAKYHVQGSTPTCPAQVLSAYDAFSLAQPSNDVWIRAYVRWRANTAWPNGHIKMLALHGYYVQPSGGTSLPSSFFGQYDGLSVYGNIPGGQLQNNRWYLVEAHIKNSAPTNFTVWIDGTQAWSRTDPQAGASLNIILFGIINTCTSTTINVDHWFDGLAVGRSRIYGSAVVEVGDSSNYSTARKKVQALERIADDQVTFKLDTSGLGSGPYYVWVRNNAQQQSAAYFLTGGQISGPSAPTNVHIVP